MGNPGGWHAPAARGHVIGIYDGGGKLLATVDVADVVPAGSEPATVRILQPARFTEDKQARPPGARPMLLTIAQAASELGVSRSTMYALLNSGEIQSLLLGPQGRRIPSAEIEAYIGRKMALAPSIGAVMTWCSSR